MVEHFFDHRHAGKSDAIKSLALELAIERGGQTTPVCGYDIDRAEEQIAGEKKAATHLRERIKALEAENTGLRIGWWNDMRKRGVSDHAAITAIKSATAPTKDQSL